jgi:hypothetical protein
MALMYSRIAAAGLLIAMVGVFVLAEDERLPNVVMFESPAIQKAVPGIRERFAWPSPQEIETTAAQQTPRLDSIRQGCERVLSLVFAPEALPRGVNDQMLALRTKDGDRVRCPRFEYKGWVVDASVWYPTVELAVTRLKASHQRPEDLADYVLVAAKDLMVGNGSRVSEIEPFGRVQETDYGIKGKLHPVLGNTDDYIGNSAKGVPSGYFVIDGQLFERWPETFVYLTDGQSILFVLTRPWASPSQKRQSDLTSTLLKDWFTKSERDIPWHE